MSTGLTSYCTLHQVAMEERYSTTKVNEDGSPKAYFGHWDKVEKAMCFGEGTGKAVRNGRASSDGKPLVNVPVKETVDWDAKDRQSLAQTAMKSASEIVAALINSGALNYGVEASETAVKEMANNFYQELKVIKQD